LYQAFREMVSASNAGAIQTKPAFFSSEPFSIVVEALQAHSKWDDILLNLPDVSLELLEKYGLVLRNNVNQQL
jgi:hypothetical protein